MKQLSTYALDQNRRKNIKNVNNGLTIVERQASWASFATS